MARREMMQYCLWWHVVSFLHDSDQHLSEDRLTDLTRQCSVSFCVWQAFRGTLLLRASLAPQCCSRGWGPKPSTSTTSPLPWTIRTSQIKFHFVFSEPTSLKWKKDCCFFIWRNINESSNGKPYGKLSDEALGEGGLHLGPWKDESPSSDWCPPRGEGAHRQRHAEILSLAVFIIWGKKTQLHSLVILLVNYPELSSRIRKQNYYIEIEK